MGSGIGDADCDHLSFPVLICEKESKTEAAYIQSGYMVPSLLLPKYLLAKLYEESGQHNKAIQTAGKILNCPVKIESTATHEIMNNMKNIMTQSGTKCPEILEKKH